MDIGIICIAMKKQDSTMYSDGELSLLVMNNEPLYRVFMTSVRMERFSFILDHVSDLYTFTQDQEDDLRETWEDEVEEEKNSLSLSSQPEARQNKTKRKEE